MSAILGHILHSVIRHRSGVACYSLTAKQQENNYYFLFGLKVIIKTFSIIMLTKLSAQNKFFSV